MTVEPDPVSLPSEGEGAAPPLVLRRPRAGIVLSVLIGVFIALAAIDVAAVSLGKDTAARMVSLDAETTIGTWWASAQLLGLAALFAILAMREARARRGAAVLALRLSVAVAVFLSIDETAGIHELLAERLGRGFFPVVGDAFDTWLVIYTMVGVVILAVAIPGIVSLVRTDRVEMSWLGLGAASLLVGGVVVEHVRNVVDPTVWDVIFEESFEFIGVAVMIWAVYRMIGPLGVSVPPRSE